jgi:hypothetical protein
MPIEEKKNTRKGGFELGFSKIKTIMTRLVILVRLNSNYSSPPAKVILPLSSEVLIHYNQKITNAQPTVVTNTILHKLTASD